jgi:hypothetical protein
MVRESIHYGVRLRLLSDCLSVHAGTLAVVDSVGTLYNGDWYFTVRWIDLHAGSEARPVSDRSVNLWESDLQKFELVSGEDATSLTAAAASRVSNRKQAKRPHVRRSVRLVNQLRLLEDF